MTAMCRGNECGKSKYGNPKEAEFGVTVKFATDQAYTENPEERTSRIKNQSTKHFPGVMYVDTWTDAAGKSLTVLLVGDD